MKTNPNAQNAFFVFFIAFFAVFFNLSAQNSAKNYVTRSLVFNKGDEGSEFYRIPAIAVANDGTIVAVADRRNESLKDLPGNIDVVCRRSTDNGKTWSDLTVVAKCDEAGGYGDPAIGVDRLTGDIVCVMTHGNGLWESTPEDHAYIMVSRSHDNGATWSIPVNITPSLFRTAVEKDSNAPIECVSAFASSGALSRLENGNLMFVLVVRDNPKKWSNVKDYACVSTDGGFTWNVAGEPADTDGDEAKIVQLTDGKLLMSIRNRRKGAHKFAVSADEGKTWSPVRSEQSVIEPGCNGDIIRYNHKGVNALLLSVPNDEKERKNVTLFVSHDEGESWKKLLTICDDKSAYSSLVALPDGSLGCLVEEGAPDGGWQLWFTRYDFDTLFN